MHATMPRAASDRRHTHSANTELPQKFVGHALGISVLCLPHTIVSLVLGDGLQLATVVRHYILYLRREVAVVKSRPSRAATTPL